MSSHQHVLVDVNNGKQLMVLELSALLKDQPVILIRLIPVVVFSRQVPITTHLVVEESSGAILGDARLPRMQGNESVVKVQIKPLQPIMKHRRKG